MKALFLCLIAIAFSSYAESGICACNDRDVAGLPAINLPCVSDAIDLGPSTYANVDNPPCPGGLGGPEVSSFLQQQLSSGAGAAASVYGGPLLGYVTQVATTNVLHSFEQMMGRDYSSTYSNCKVLAVKVPKGYHTVKMLGVAQDETGRTYCGIPAPCGGIGYSAMDEPNTEGVGDVQVSSVRAKNWSGNRTRHFELLVYYDRN
ncbi:MAG TPA: hypothetical protein VJQ54_09355 [Candidatus Sulfotelmatobacter sp.]|nr:hypothetical protein [Candidatus Sulfotelmatobacter sp.]